MSGAVRAVAAGRCLDVNDSSTTSGTQVQVWSCNGQDNQQCNRQWNQQWNQQRLLG